jgi:hypothetical protein
MNIKLILACWVAGKDEAHEEVEINEDELLDVLRGAAGPVPKTQPRSTGASLRCSGKTHCEAI